MSDIRSQLVGGVVAVVGVGAAVLAARHIDLPWQDRGPSAIDLALERRQELQARYAAQQSAPRPLAPAAIAPPLPTSRACDFAPALRRSTPDDGQFSAGAASGMRGLPDARAFVSVARDAAAHGRNRDAEAAFVMACRMQSQRAPGSELLADIERSLARHYVDAAAEETSPDLRERALGRARELLADAVRIYGGALGPQAAKTRDGEQALREVGGGSDPALAVDAQSAASVDAVQSVAAPEPRPLPEARRTSPDALVAADPDLAQLDGNLRRLREQAERVSDDPEGLRQRSAAARAARERCQDRACLLHWYASRRAALLAEF